MKGATKRDHLRVARRRFLGLLAGLGAGGAALAFARNRPGPRELDLKEADFYRPHDLAG
jgi:hypothetical protein